MKRLVYCFLVLIAFTINIAAQDSHSYANPWAVRVQHVDLDWDVLFEQKILKGTSTLTIKRTWPTEPLILDTRDLKIERVETSVNGLNFTPATFNVGKSDKILGAPLTISLPARATRVRIHYSTSPGASGLQWLTPAQTAGKKEPFMFSQSQAIHARSWIPLQDTPAVRMTYNARVRTPRNLLTVMSAENDARTPRDGDYSFRMRQPIPSYLIALAVGDLRFRSLGPRTGVYAEPQVIDGAARELSDIEQMVVAIERFHGPYRWGRYDILVLPPSFPYGGMENPRLTFITPTILAGDESLITPLTHDLAHSWSGNLVTNATWDDFWLNESFTVYLERRIQESVNGRALAEREAALGLRGLQEELDMLEEDDEILHVDLKGRDPDEGFTEVPYEKGALFLLHLEQTFGRARFDHFLRSYFNYFAFQSITTEQFLAYLKQNLLDKYPALAARVPVDDWIENPGLPASAPKPTSQDAARVEGPAKRWLRGEISATQIPADGWTTQERLHFLNFVQNAFEPPPSAGGPVADGYGTQPSQTEKSRLMGELDRAFNLTRSGNSEIASQWLLMSIRNKYEPAYPRLEEFLLSVGRRKFIRLLYQELTKTPEGRKRALEIYRRARPMYDPISVRSIDQDLNWPRQ